MNYDIDQRPNEQWIKAGSLLLDLSSMENGFLKIKRYRQEIWDYIRYRESLVTWPVINEKIKMGLSLHNGSPR
jgi:hypothetical protein